MCKHNLILTDKTMYLSPWAMMTPEEKAGLSPAEWMFRVGTALTLVCSECGWTRLVCSGIAVPVQPSGEECISSFRRFARWLKARFTIRRSKELFRS